MLLEHLVYSTAIAIVLGTLYRRYTGRDHAWLVVASAYVPDLDIVADGLLQRILHSRQFITSQIQNGCILTKILNGVDSVDKCNCSRYVLTHNDG